MAFTGQAFLSLVMATWVLILAKSGRLDVLHEEGSAENAIERKRLEYTTDILMVGNDVQMITGALGAQLGGIQEAKAR